MYNVASVAPIKMGLCSSASAEKPITAAIPPEDDCGAEEVEGGAVPIGSAHHGHAATTVEAEQDTRSTGNSKRAQLRSAGWAAAVSAKRKKLPKLPAHVARQFADHERIGLEILFATHAHNKKGTGEVHMGPRGLARACALPHAHVHASTEMKRTEMKRADLPVADVFATRLYQAFGGGNQLLDYKDFAAGCSELRHAGPQDRLAFMFRMFDDGQAEESKDGSTSIARSGIVRLTVSMLLMASVDAELKDGVVAHGLDYFSIDVEENEALTAVVEEWVDESFGGKSLAVEKKQQGKTTVTFKEFKSWFETLSLSVASLQPKEKHRELAPQIAQKDEEGGGVGEKETPVARSLPPPPAERSSDDESGLDDDGEEENGNSVMTGLDLAQSSDDDGPHLEIAGASKTVALRGREDYDGIEMSSGGTGYI